MIKAIAAGDFTGNGKDDLAVVRSGSQKVLVYTGGRLSRHHIGTIAVEGWGDIDGVTAGNFDSNGNDDEIAVFEHNNLRVYKKNGTLLSQGSWGGYGYAGIAAGDFNGDGKDEIAVYRRDGRGNSTKNRIVIFDGQCQLLAHYALWGYNFGSIAGGDYDGDGIDEILTHRRVSSGDDSPRRLMVMNMNSSNPLEQTYVHEAVSQHEGFEVGHMADLDGDGIDDIIGDLFGEGFVTVESSQRRRGTPLCSGRNLVQRIITGGEL